MYVRMYVRMFACTVVDVVCADFTCVCNTYVYTYYIRTYVHAYVRMLYICMNVRMLYMCMYICCTLNC